MVRIRVRVCLLLTEDGGHLFLQVTDDAHVRLGQPHALDQLVDLADGGVLGDVLEVSQQVAHLRLQQLRSGLGNGDRGRGRVKIGVTVGVGVRVGVRLGLGVRLEQLLAPLVALQR